MIITRTKRLPAAIVRDLDLPVPFDLSQFISKLAARRQRPVFLHRIASVPGTPCGLWIATAEADHIFHEQDTTPWHTTHIILHEIAHILLAHEGDDLGQYSLTRLLAPDIDPALARLVLGRTAYSAPAEREAETLASLILESVSAALNLAGTAPRGDAAIPWLRALRRAGWRGRLWMAYWRLRPLWAALVQAAPEVRLPIQPGKRLSVCYRLHRRVIEIRDAQLALRPYLSGDVAATARAAAQSAGLAADRCDAAAEAAAIESALHARLGGHPAREDSALPAQTSPAAASDLATEASRLLLVLQAVRHSPVMRPGGADSGLCSRHRRSHDA